MASKSLGRVKPLGRPSVCLSLCSGFFAILFGYSASVQLNDHDWYSWLPLYSLACLVCLANAVRFTYISRLFAYFDLLCGSLLFIKVVSEACIRDKLFSWTEFLSLDMNQSLVREKYGSFLVCMAMWLELEISGGALGKKFGSQNGLHAGMLLLVSTSIALCVIYYTRRIETLGEGLGAEL